MASQEALEFAAGEPPFPFGRLQASACAGVFVNNDDPPARLHHAADLAHGFVDFDRVLQAFGSIGGIESGVRKRQLGHRTGAHADARGREAQHLERQVQPADFGRRLLVVQNAGEAAFTAAHVEHSPPGQFAQVPANQLHMINARIDGGGEVHLIAGGPVERGADAGAQLAGKPRTPPRKQMPPVQASGPGEEDGQSELVIVDRPEALGVVHGFDFDMPRT